MRIFSAWRVRRNLAAAPSKMFPCFSLFESTTGRSRYAVCAAILRALLPMFLFVPDKHLGRWVQGQTHKKMILWAGCCPTHQRMKAKDIIDLKQEHPDALVVVHPESNEDICNMADAVLSTSQMLRYCQASPAMTFIIGTEMGMLHRLRTTMPEKTFLLPTKSLICPNMKMTQLEDVYEALKELKHPIEIPEHTRIKPLKALDGMRAAVPTK